MGHIKPVVVVRGDLPGTGRRRVDGLGPEVAVVDVRGDLPGTGRRRVDGLGPEVAVVDGPAVGGGNVRPVLALAQLVPPGAASTPSGHVTSPQTEVGQYVG
eukprot:1091503-Pyramimonas_sp.AAC.1